jgi:hypothetical protein
MTIRDYLRRRIRLIWAAAFAAWLLVPLSVAVTADHVPPPLLIIPCMLLFGGAIVSLLFLVRCPRCHTRFGQVAGEIAFHWGSRGRVNFCPYCGVSLDEPYEAPREIR